MPKELLAAIILDVGVHLLVIEEELLEIFLVLLEAETLLLLLLLGPLGLVGIEGLLLLV